jgi:hypothetical protein
MINSGVYVGVYVVGVGQGMTTSCDETQAKEHTKKATTG